MRHQAVVEKASLWNRRCGTEAIVASCAIITFTAAPPLPIKTITTPGGSYRPGGLSRMNKAERSPGSGPRPRGQRNQTPGPASATATPPAAITNQSSARGFRRRGVEVG
jgi:hypothetical protein